MGAGRFTKVLLRELVAALPAERQHRFKKRRFVRRRPQLLLQHRIGENRCPDWKETLNCHGNLTKTRARC